MLNSTQKPTSFHPPKRVLMGPGPTTVSDRVLSAMARPTIGHLDPAFVVFMDSLKELLRAVFQTKNDLTFPVSGPGSAGMELCFVNLVEPGEKVVVCINGVFGARMRENVERCGGIPIVLEFDWGRAVDPEAVRKALKTHADAKIVAFVHAETSTGALSDAESIIKVAKENGCLTIMDAVTSLAGVPVLVDEWGVDAVYSGSQKCLSCPPGLSPVTFNAKAVDKIKNRKSKVQSWFLDLTLVMSYWGSASKRTYHHTSPINALYGLHEGLVMLFEEGLANSWKRHQDMHLKLANGLQNLGLELIVPPAERLPQLNAVQVPQGVDEAKVRERLLDEFGLEIGAGLGRMAGKIWRIGLMGGSATEWHVDFCLRSFEKVLA